MHKRQVEDPFYIIDVSKIVRQMLKWRKFLPRVKPFYAMKCNPTQVLVRIIEAMGGGFDCASKAEIATALSNNVDPATRVIFANPCKQVSHIKYAKSAGVEYCTVDNEDELHKIKQHWSECKVIIRIKTDDSKSVCQFSSKFGADVHKDCPRLLQLGKELGLNLVGVSFHVGSGCYDAKLFVKALEAARQVFDMAKEEGFDFKMLDLGGGWPGDNEHKPSFEEIADTIRDPINELFPLQDNIEVIAEPGRYFACASHTLVTNVIARRECNKGAKKEPVHQDVKESPVEYLYYINDGIYGSFNCIVFDHSHIKIRHIPNEEVKTGVAALNKPTMHKSTIFGPTCDSMDKLITTEVPKLNVGDWLFFPEFGAYTTASSSQFNGFQTVTKHYIYRN